MSRPASYREQNGCANCKHVFVKYEAADDFDFYCARKDAARPLCGSVWMDEDVSPGTLKDGSDEFHDERGRVIQAWCAWREGRDVERHGICDEWEGEEGDGDE